MAELAAEAARLLRMREKDILSLRLLRRSVDAGKKSAWSTQWRSRSRRSPLFSAEPGAGRSAGPHRPRRTRRRLPCLRRRCLPWWWARARGALRRPGAGPGGAAPHPAGAGPPVERRKADVERFWATGELDLTSNVQFGEGGAGAFSDGKLNTGTRDPRHRFILETLVSCGAPGGYFDRCQTPCGHGLSPHRSGKPAPPSAGTGNGHPV